MVTLASVWAGTTSASLFWRRRDLRAGGSSLTVVDLLQKADQFLKFFKDLLWMIVYFSLQNTKCIYLQARGTLKDPAEMAVSTFSLLLLPFELSGKTTVTANTANAISQVELRLIRKSLDKSA